jgi:SAM-dependent methyltransferase
MVCMGPTALAKVSPANEIHIVQRVCPQCGADNSGQPASRYSLPPWIIRDCASCDFVYIDSAPAYEHLYGPEETVYGPDDTDEAGESQPAQHSLVPMDWETTFAAEETRRLTSFKLTYTLDKLTRWRLRILAQPKPCDFVRRFFTGGRILDLGCAAGEGMRDFAESWTPYGIEVSTNLARQANSLCSQHGGHVENAPCIEGLERFPEEYFEAVVARSYLEHEANPLGVLKETHRVLKPGGIVVVKVPNYSSLNRRVMGRRWCGFRYPDHLNYFTPRSLRRLAENCGFTFNSSLMNKLPTDDNMWAVLTKPVI